MENMDYCVSNFAHLGNRIKCQKCVHSSSASLLLLHDPVLTRAF